MARFFGWVPVVVAGLLGCGPEQEGAQGTEVPVEVSLVQTAEIDLDGIVARIERTFRTIDGAHAAKGDRHRVSVSARGISLSPQNDAPSFALERTTIWRGSAELPTSTRLSVLAPDTVGRGFVDANGALGVEQVVNRQDAIEQRWVVDREPTGTGGLRFEVGVSGYAYCGQDEEALHFVDGTSGQRMRYGVATWIDGRGRRTSLVPRFEAGQIAIEVPEALVDESVYPAVLDPVIGPEFDPEDPTLAGTVAVYNPSRQAIAYGDGQYLIVWPD
jgi:large repetitive protein